MEIIDKCCPGLGEDVVLSRVLRVVVLRLQLDLQRQNPVVPFDNIKGRLWELRGREEGVFGAGISTWRRGSKYRHRIQSHAHGHL